GLQLGLQQGSKLQIGGVDFFVSDIVERDASSVGSGFSFAPTIYLSLQSLAETKLIQLGSTGYYEKLYRFPSEINVVALAEQINESLSDPAIRVKLPDKASEQVGRGLGYVTDYLGL